jgi:ribulose-phosphate 3-epimerase
MERIISPSMLSADFGNLDRDTRMIDRSAAQWIHIDVMDGVFVPNISFGFPVMKPIRKASDKVLDVHLMIVEPEKYVARFAEAGADIVTFHYEATSTPEEAIRLIRESGAKVGISIKPKTPVEVLFPLLPELDLVLIMTVEPGFGGQKYMPVSTERIRRLREEARKVNPGLKIEVDGGIKTDNVRIVLDAGADLIVAGSAVYGSDVLGQTRAFMEILQS